MTERTDAIVIGGGLHGCATALHLARAGLSPVVIEKDHVGRHASSANAGGVRRLGRALPEIPLADAALRAWHAIGELVDDDCGFSSSSQVKVAETESELQALRDSRVGTRRELPLVDHVLSRFVTKGTFERQLEGDVHGFPCRELKDLLYMLPNGDVVRCGLDHEPIGNLRETRFDDLWFGDRMKAYRQKVANCPGCLQASVQILSRVYGGCPLA